MKKKLLVCLMGPTASGKTQLAMQLVQHFPFDIISVDSALVYRGMDIGTAKPDADILAKAPHRLINIRDPKDAYSAAQFREDALLAMKEIDAQGKIPLLVGGTMLYFRALLQGLSDLPHADPAVREKLAEQAEKIGWPMMHAKLAEVDPSAAARIHPHDAQRISRALEVYELTGKSLTACQKESGEALQDYTVIALAIAPQDRTILHERIEERFKKMLAEGLIEEVRRLYERGDLVITLPAIKSVGYRQVWEFLTGSLSFAEMQTKGIIATRQLAKRQLTWLRHWPDVVWFDSEAENLSQQVVDYLKDAMKPNRDGS